MGRVWGLTTGAATEFALCMVSPSVARADVMVSAAPTAVTASMECSRGPKAAFNAIVTMPRSGATGTTFTVRIDSTPSGRISHTGLNYIHEMVTDYVLPKGASYVANTVRVVAGTGTPNARVGARSWRDALGVHMALPAHIDNGSSYTPPSLAFDLKIDAPPGTVLAIQFAHYAVTANVFLLGDLHTTCEPSARPAIIGETLVAPRLASEPAP